MKLEKFFGGLRKKAISGVTAALLTGCGYLDTTKFPALDYTGSRPIQIFEEDIKAAPENRQAEEGILPGVFAYNIEPALWSSLFPAIFRNNLVVRPLNSADGRPPPFDVSVLRDVIRPDGSEEGRIVLTDNNEPFFQGSVYRVNFYLEGTSAFPAVPALTVYTVGFNLSPTTNPLSNIAVAYGRRGTQFSPEDAANRSFISINKDSMPGADLPGSLNSKIDEGESTATLFLHSDLELLVGGPAETIVSNLGGPGSCYNVSNVIPFLREGEVERTINNTTSRYAKYTARFNVTKLPNCTGSGFIQVAAKMNGFTNPETINDSEFIGASQ